MTEEHGRAARFVARKRTRHQKPTPPEIWHDDRGELQGRRTEDEDIRETEDHERKQ